MTPINQDVSDEFTLADLQPSAKHEKLKQAMLSAINAMRGRKAEVWKLLLQDKTQDDIARILNISRSSVETYYKRGIKEIRRLCK